jgi:hypothetical protein
VVKDKKQHKMFFVIGTTIVVFLLVVYFATEGWALLHTPQREFVFWVLTITCETGLLVLSRDSPIRTVVMTVLGGDPHVKATPAQLLLFFGIAVPTVSGYVLSWKQMKELRPYNPIRSRSENSAFAHRTPVSARAKQVDVNALLERVAYNSHVRYLVSLLRGKLHERQDKLKSIFENATPDELNHLLRSTNLPQLLQYGDLAESFVRGRVKSIDHLSPLPKAVAMHALMKINTLPFHRGQREWIRTLFCSTSGDELTVLKMHLDGTTDYHNLYKLVYTDVTDEDLRKEILDHIREQGNKVAKMNQEKNQHSPVKILSDVDDTLWCSGGRWPAGVDKAYPRHAVYPGALAFYEEIDVKGLGTGEGNSRESSGEIIETDTVKVSVDIPHERGGGTASIRVSSKETIETVQTKITENFKLPPWNQRLTITSGSSGSVSTNSRGHNLVFLSARPHAFKDLTESSSYKRFTDLFDEGRLHTHPTLLAGSLRSGARAIWGDVVVKCKTYIGNALQIISALVLSLDDKLHKPQAMDSLRKLAEKWVNEDAMANFDSSIMGINANWEAVGRFKAETFEKFADLYPECCFLFIGDDGQGDVLSSEIMSKRLGGSAKRPIALIHRVVPDRKDILSTLVGKDLEEKEKLWREMGIRFFNTFVGAATILLESGLITPRVVHRVGVIAREEIIELILEQPSFEGWANALKVLNEDINKANAEIRRASGGNPKAMTIEEVKMPY